MNLAALENIANAKALLQAGPPSRAVSLAITKLDEARLWLIEASGE